MQEKLLREILTEIGGKHSINLCGILYGKKHVNEFLIAKKLNMTINQTRNILYKLLEVGIISFTKKKDKKKAWYTYLWTLNTLKSLEELRRRIEKRINDLKTQLEIRRTRRFYVCKNCGIEVNEENALINDFSCQECGEVYELNDDPKIFEEIEGEIVSLEKHLGDVKKEIEKETEKIEKSKLRKQRKEDKKKAEERAKKLAERRAKRAEEKKALEQKEGKTKKPKKVAKKPAKKTASKSTKAKKSNKKK